MKFSKSLSSNDMVLIVAERFRDYRRSALLTQQEAADRAGVSKTTVYNFENGRLLNVSLRTVIDLMRAVGMVERVDSLLPQIPLSPYLIDDYGNKVKRITHKRNVGK